MTHVQKMIALLAQISTDLSIMRAEMEGTRDRTRSAADHQSNPKHHELVTMAIDVLNEHKSPMPGYLIQKVLSERGVKFSSARPGAYVTRVLGRETELYKPRLKRVSHGFWITGQ